MKKLFAVLLSAGLLLSASACDFIINDADENRFDYPVTVGNMVFNNAPSKVAVLSDNIADIIIACGYEGKLSAISDSCTNEALSVLPSVGTADEPSKKKISELGIDLVIGDESIDPDYKDELMAAGTDVLIIKPATNENELKKLYNSIASILGGGYNGKMKAMSTLESIQNQVDDIKMQLGDESVMTTGCYIYELSDDQCSVAYGNCYVSSLLDSARVTNVLAEDDNGFVGIDMLLKSNPDVIFCDTGIADKIAGNEDLRSLKALDSGKIFTLPKKYVQLQGKTRIITVDYIADKAHDSYQSTQKWPEEFQDAAEKYVPPFTPKEGIYYTVGETYKNIKDVEERLISLGYMEGTADETFTEDTANAVKYFQSMNNLEVTGIADYKTLSVLLSDKALANNGSGNDEVTVEY